NNIIFMVLIILIYSSYELILSLNEVIPNIFFSYFVLYLIPYGLVALIGLRVASDTKFVNLILIMSCVAFTIIQIKHFIDGHGFEPNSFKYPPRLYYISYGLVIGLSSYKFLQNKSFILNKRFLGSVQWLSKNSFKVYLFHIFSLFGLMMLKVLLEDSFALHNFIIQFILVSSSAIIATALFNKMALKFKNLI
ncbi:hypothetical protein ACFRAM_27070, partial [Paenibacillus sp. NPDC056722]|uniref:hypothetical protein n=1 Tax=Paenibacillus sp. NPDC056722 TaxID=3345924 RepID=UPI0036B1A74F